MKDMSIVVIGFSIVAAIIIACGTGYVKNIFKLVECDFESPYKCEVVHGLGLIPVIGIVTGYIDIDE